MSKSIKLSDTTYKRLQDFCLKKETFSDAVLRLLTVYHNVLVAFSGRPRNGQS